MSPWRRSPQCQAMQIDDYHIFTVDVYSSWTLQYIIRLCGLSPPPHGNFFAAIAVGSRIKHEHDPRVRMAHPRSGFAKGIKRTLCLSLYDPRKPRLNRQIIQPNGFIIVQSKRDICWNPVSFFKEVESVSIVGKNTITKAKLVFIEIFWSLYKGLC